MRPLHAEGAGDGAGDSEECAVDYYEDMERRDTALELKYTRWGMRGMSVVEACVVREGCCREAGARKSWH